MSNTISGLNSQVSQNLVSNLSSNNNDQLRSEIAISVLKKQQSQAEFLVQSLIVAAPQPTTPKSMNSTFEFKV